jgi:hypothetical protein
MVRIVYALLTPYKLVWINERCIQAGEQGVFRAIQFPGKWMANLHKKQAGRHETHPRKISGKSVEVHAYQFIYVWQSKFQSIPLCAVDAPRPSLQRSSLFQQEGGYEK